MEEAFGHPVVIPVLGFAVGLVGTIIGAGGGFFVVPYLLLVFNMDPPVSTGTSLWLVLANSVSSTARNLFSPGKIDYGIGTTLAVCSIPGAMAGREIIQSVPAGPFQIGFAVLLSATAAYSAWMRPREEARPRPRDGRLFLVCALVSLGTGCVASMFGIGGGLIYVPLMMFVFGMSAVASTATSQFCLVFTSLAAVLWSLSKGQTDWMKVLLLGPGVVVGAQAGVWVLPRISRTTVRRVLAVVCVIVAVELVIKAVI